MRLSSPVRLYTTRVGRRAYLCVAVLALVTLLAELGLWRWARWDTTLLPALAPLALVSGVLLVYAAAVAAQRDFYHVRTGTVVSTTLVPEHLETVLTPLTTVVSGPGGPGVGTTLVPGDVLVLERHEIVVRDEHGHESVLVVPRDVAVAHPAGSTYSAS